MVSTKTPVMCKHLAKPTSIASCMSGTPLVIFSPILWYPLHSKYTCSQYEVYGMDPSHYHKIDAHLQNTYVGWYSMKRTCVLLLESS